MRTRKCLSMLLVLSLMLSLVTVPAMAAEGEHWAQSAVTTLNDIYGSSIFTASNDSLSPSDANTILSSMGLGASTEIDESFTRADACTVLANAFNLNTTAYGSAIAYMNAQGIINGTSTGGLNEAGGVTKAEFAVLTYRVLNHVGSGIKSESLLKPGTDSYYAWKYLYVRTCVPGEDCLSTTMANVSSETFNSIYDGWTTKEDGSQTLKKTAVYASDGLSAGEALWNRWVSALKDTKMGGVDDFDPTKSGKAEAISYSGSDTVLQAAVKLMNKFTDENGVQPIFVDVVQGDFNNGGMYYDGVMYLCDHEIVQGEGAGAFNPTGSLSRFELVALLQRAGITMSTPSETKLTYHQNESGGNAFYANLIEMGLNDGYLIAPITNGFATDADQVAEWATGTPDRREVIYAVIKAYVDEETINKVNLNVLDQFTDKNSIGAAYEKCVAYAVSIGLVSGQSDGSLNPTGDINRGEMGVFFYRALLGLDETKIQDYSEDVEAVKQGTSSASMMRMARSTNNLTLPLDEEWRLTSDLDLNIPTGTTLTITNETGNSFSIYEMGGILKNTGGGTIIFEDAILYPAATDEDAATITATNGWGADESTKLMELRAPVVSYDITFDVKNSENETISAPQILVTNMDGTAVEAVDGKYTLNAADSYSYVVTASGYGAYSGTIEDGNTKTTIHVVLNASETEGSASVGEITEVTIAEGVPEAVAEEIANIIKNAAVSGVADGLTDNGIDSILSAANVYDVSDGVVLVVVSTEIKVTSAEMNDDGTATSVTYSATPTARVYVNGTKSGSDVSVSNSYLSNANIKVNLPLPNNFTPVEIMHISSTGTHERFLESGNRTFTFDSNSDSVSLTIGHFSIFEVNGVETKAATVGSTTYGTLQEAIDAASSGSTIMLSDDFDSSETVTVGAKSLTIVLNEKTYDTGKITVTNSRTTVSDDGDGNIVITYTAPSYSGDGGGTSYYSITIEDADNGSVSSNRSTAYSGAKVKLTISPDNGYVVDTLVVRSSNGNEVDVTDNGDGTYSFVMPSGRVTVTATFAEIYVEPEVVFTDVYEGDYYYDAVYWAVKNGVTEGTSVEPATFSPLLDCTRAQAVTFLWRAAGSPEPETAVNPFADVPENAYYAKAVLWAVENGITYGTNAEGTTFSPDGVCTRAQIVTMIYRMVGSPAVSGNSFSDVPSDAYYADATIWAVQNGVTNGTNSEGTTFSPENICTRAQIVTFLYRHFVK